MTSKKAHQPLLPSTDLFEPWEPLSDFFKCWVGARANNMLPLKRDFESQLLSFPDLVPNMSLIEMDADGELMNRFLGSGVVKRRDVDQTGKSMRGIYGPKAEELIFTWARASFETPNIAFVTARTLMPSGAITENLALCAGLSKGQGVQSCIATMPFVEEWHVEETKWGEFFIGSEGMEIEMLDIGFGLPDIPVRTD